MSLILEALKKLERDKQAPDRGFLVVAHVPWAAKGRGRRLWVGVAGMLLVLAVSASLFLAWPRPRGDTVPAAADKAGAREATPSSSPGLPSPVPPVTTALPSVARPESAPVRVPPPAREATPPRSTPREAAVPATTIPASSEVELRLNAISRQDGRWVAVLNDRLVREGDEFDGIRVVRIDESEVEVEVAGRRRTVRF